MCFFFWNCCAVDSVIILCKILTGLQNTRVWCPNYHSQFFQRQMVSPNWNFLWSKLRYSNWSVKHLNVSSRRRNICVFSLQSWHEHVITSESWIQFDRNFYFIKYQWNTPIVSFLLCFCIVLFLCLGFMIT